MIATKCTCGMQLRFCGKDCPKQNPEFESESSLSEMTPTWIHRKQMKEKVEEIFRLNDELQSLKQHNLKLTECLGELIGILNKRDVSLLLDNVDVSLIAKAKSLIK